MSLLLRLVPVPVLPPEPPLRTSGTTLGWAIGLLGLAGLLGFAVFTVRAILNVPFRKHEVRVAAWLSFGGLALLAVSYVEWRIYHYRQDGARDTWWEARQEADDAAQAALEEAYGITFKDSVLTFPMEEEPFPWEMKVELADGTLSTCWLSAQNRYFEISCGPDPETAVPPPTIDGSPSAPLPSAADLTARGDA